MDPRNLGKEFREFLLKTNMFAMAMGVVIGGAVGKVVQALVDDLVMPFVGVVTPAGDWRAIKLGFWRFNFTIGHLMGTIVDFIIIATVVFFITKAFVRNQAPPPPAPTKACPKCLEGIHPDAKRCKFCTSDL
jgi:large conductance mechanosensitive channel